MSCDTKKNAQTSNMHTRGCKDTGKHSIVVNNQTAWQEARHESRRETGSLAVFLVDKFYSLHGCGAGDSGEGQISNPQDSHQN